MKKVLTLTLCVTLCVFLLTALCGCAGTPASPETNLEFRIAENVDGTDFSGCIVIAAEVSNRLGIRF